MSRPRGWTDRIIQAVDRLGAIEYRRGNNFIGLKPIDAQTFLAMAEWVSEDNLEEGQNRGPSLRTFLALAEKEPDALFQGYIITAERNDERLTIECVHVPKAFNFTGTGIDPATADEDDLLESGYRRLWWD